MRHHSYRTLVIVVLAVAVWAVAPAQQPLSPTDVFALQYIGDVAISPDGSTAAYTVSQQRPATDPAGTAYSQLYAVSLSSGAITPLVTGKVRVSSVSWRPGTDKVSYVTTPEGGRSQVFVIPSGGGEPVQVTSVDRGVSAYEWSPSGSMLGYISTEGPTSREKALDEKGYGFIYFEENLKNRNLFVADVGKDDAAGAGRQVTAGINVWSFAFAPDGKNAVIGASPKNLVDHMYAFQHIYVADLKGGTPRKVSKNEGKLGNYAVSPDGKLLAYSASFDQKDNAVSQAYVIPLAGGDVVNLTPPNFKGHVEWVGWKDSRTILYRAGEGVNVTLNTVGLDGKGRKTILDSRKTGMIFGSPVSDKNMKIHLFECTSPTMPSDLYVWKDGGSMARLTNVNAFLAERTLGEQKVITYKARDGQPIEGLLILPVGYSEGTAYPLVMLVHGGPESHHSNSWLTSYSTPGQVLAGKGYAVLYTNYRSSTGYGLQFAATGYGDAAGVEFDDLADGIEHLIAQGIADKERVGMGGGSYGGFASAWFATYYTKYVKAVCMFVGISDLISKRGTTDIPYEELFVHSGKKLEDMWELSLQRSPIYHAKQSRTATLIIGGTADPRVHPAQSLELYRRMKMNDHPAVRLVQYPGEGHGNARQPGRIDVLYRVLDWYDWYVKDANPLNGPMPPLDLSGKYGLELPE